MTVKVKLQETHKSILKLIIKLLDISSTMHTLASFFKIIIHEGKILVRLYESFTGIHYENCGDIFV